MNDQPATDKPADERDDPRDLVLSLTLAAPREKIWRCWTEEALLKQWFAPKPWTIARAEIDLRPGGSSLFVMRNPEGEEFPNQGVYLEVVEGERLVFTDAYTEAWKPAAKPFFTAIVTMEEEEGGKTRYKAIVRHWTDEDRARHEEMGFHEGWGQCARQLEALAQTL